MYMAEEKCFQFTVKNKDKVQDVGLRLAIAKRVPDELEVRADNLPDGSVMVFVKGKEGDVKKFWNNLQKDILGKIENPTFSELKIIPVISIDTNRFFHKLECEQLGKFVGVGLEMRDAMIEMKNGFKDLPKNIANAVKGK